MPQYNRWSDEAKRKFRAEIQRGDAYPAMARRYGLAVSTVKQYDKEFRSESRHERQVTNENVDVTARVKLPNFDPVRLTSFRVERGYSTSELGAKAGLPARIVEGFELGKFVPYANGTKGGPAPVHRLARALGITVADLQVPQDEDEDEDEGQSPKRDEAARFDAIERKLDMLLSKLGAVA